MALKHWEATPAEKLAELRQWWLDHPREPMTDFRFTARHRMHPYPGGAEDWANFLTQRGQPATVPPAMSAGEIMALYQHDDKRDQQTPRKQTGSGQRRQQTTKGILRRLRRLVTSRT